MDSRGGDDGRLVEAARDGDERAFGELFDRWFDPVYDIAWRIVRDRDTAAEVAQDVFLVAWTELGTLEQAGSFGGWVRRIARNRALNRLDRERRSRPDEAATTAALDRSAPDVDMTAALGEREQRELVWAASAALGERDASLLDLHLRHGMGAADIATELGVTTNNAHQLLHRLKGKLGGAIRAWVLWRGAAGSSADLDRAVSAADVSAFGADAVRVVDRHARGCDRCRERQQLRLAPDALFAAVPIAVAPTALKAGAASALADAGVPMAGSSVLGDPASGGDLPADGGADGPAEGGTDLPADGGDHVPADGVTAPGDGGVEAPADGVAEAPAEPGVAPGAPDAGSGPGPWTPPDPDAVTPVEGTPVTRGPGIGPAPDLGEPPPPAAAGSSRRRRAVVLAACGAAVVAVGLAVVAGAGDGGEVATSPSRTTTTGATTPPSGPTAPGSSAPAEVVVPAPSTEADTVPRTDVPAEAPATDTAPPAVDPLPPDTTTTTAPPPPAPAPAIGGFRATSGSVCDTATGDVTVTLTWRSSDADSASVAGQGGLPPSGSTTTCAAPGSSFTLVVTGPGGSDQETVTAV